MSVKDTDSKRKLQECWQFLFRKNSVFIEDSFSIKELFRNNIRNNK